MKLVYAAACETGLSENINQDRIYCGCSGSEGVFLVADGMGGHHDGEKASSTVQEEILLVWEKLRECKSGNACFEETDMYLKEALSEANQRILEKTGKGKISGSTAVLLHAAKGRVTVFSCGDSRCYMVSRKLTGRKARCVTKDDERGGKLIRAIGTETDFSCSEYHIRLKPPMLFALCSDGIHKYTGRETLNKMLETAVDPSGISLTNAIDLILSEVYRAGAPDNLSLILIRVEADE